MQETVLAICAMPSLGTVGRAKIRSQRRLSRPYLQRRWACTVQGNVTRYGVAIATREPRYCRVAHNRLVAIKPVRRECRHRLFNLSKIGGMSPLFRPSPTLYRV